MPFEEWLEKLADLQGSAAIDGRIALLRRGSLGKNVREIGEGLIELKVETGPGYRMYIADDGRDSLILCAGSKRTQNEDINMAKRYWNDYKARR